MNPLLLAATTASNPALGAALHHSSHHHNNNYINNNNNQQGAGAGGGGAGGPIPPSLSFQQQQQQQQQQQHSSHGQTPTNIRSVRPPEYFPEWKEVGYEEAVFLGAQVAAKVVFVVDQGLSKGFMTRQEYNEVGPQGIHDSTL